MQTLRSITERIKAKALSLGFSLVGVTDASPLKEYTRYVDWLDRNFHAGMDFLATPFHRHSRIDPRLLVPETQAIIVLGLEYPLHNLQELSNLEIGLISGYAAGEDYHARIPRMLRDFNAALSDEFSTNPVQRIFTDSAPILERELGSRAGLGWIGKNSCLISPKIGSAFLLAEVFLDQPLQTDAPFIHDLCGTCDRCLKACPTGCIQPDRTIDARHCISYHTIENRGEIPHEVMERSGNWLFGCDICQMVCPWNSKRIQHPSIQDDSLVLEKDQLFQLLTLSDEGYQLRFGKTSLSRTKIKGLMRNALITLGNLADKTTIDALNQFIASTTDPLLIQTARWAIDQME